MEENNSVAAKSKSAPSKAKLGLLFLGVFVGAILVVVITLALRGSTKSKPTTMASNVGPAGTVSITSSGFEPQSIKIKVGQTVTWTNNDALPHQVATDPYPTEDGLVGFKSQNATLKSKTYSFTFARAGVFAYHDRLNPSKFTGTVIVE